MKNCKKIVLIIVAAVLIGAAVAAIIIYREDILDVISELKFKLSQRRCNCICIDDRDDFED